MPFWCRAREARWPDGLSAVSFRAQNGQCERRRLAIQRFSLVCRVVSARQWNQAINFYVMRRTSNSCVISPANPETYGQTAATLTSPPASHSRMSAVQVIRGTAALPPDLEERFRRAYGREMNDRERKFFGLKRKIENATHREAHKQVLKVA
jgi:hypothetical protein